MKILLADDHSVVREGLKRILNKICNTSEIDEADTGPDALEMIRSYPYDLVILDISMPGLSGLDILRSMKDSGLERNVLILSVHPQEQYAIRALRLGASGYLSKESAFEELEQAIRRIAAGRRYISSALAEKIALDAEVPAETNLHERLSEREFQVMCMLAKGTPVIEIGRALHISEKTVSTHRSRLLEKMGMKKNAELTVYAIRNNLIE